MISQPWWERFPGRLEAEFDELDKAGIRYERDAGAWEQGFVRLHAWPTIDKVEVELVAVYPDLYPYFRFEVFAPPLGLGHHQNPVTGALCLIGRRTEEWDSNDDLAEFLAERLPMTLEAGRAESGTEAVDREQRQAEPISDYYPYLGRTAFLVDGSWVPPGDRGTFTARVTIENPNRVLGALTELCDETGRVVARAEEPPRFEDAHNIQGHWIRVEEPLLDRDPNVVLASLRPAGVDPDRPRWRKVGTWMCEIVAIVFPEEHEWRTDSGWGWTFIVSLGKPRR